MKLYLMAVVSFFAHLFGLDRLRRHLEISRAFRRIYQRGATGGELGNGTRVGYSVTSPVVYTRIGQIMNITKFISLAAAVVDTTVMGASNIMTGGPGMIPIPQFDIDLLMDLDPATSPTHEFLRNYHVASPNSTAGTVIYFGIEVPVNRAQTSFRKFEFQGFVNGYTPAVAIAAMQKLTISIVFAGSYAVYPPAAATIN